MRIRDLFVYILLVVIVGCKNSDAHKTAHKEMGKVLK
jgi:hypothetical protein